MISDEIKVLVDATARLDRANLPYMLSGSLACSYYSPPRLTRDIDLVVQFPADKAERFVESFHDDYYLDPQAVAHAAATRGSFNLIHYEAVLKVDVFVARDTDHRRVEFLRRRRVEIAGAAIWIAAPEDLVLSKLDGIKESRSSLHMEDVRNLLTSVPVLDHQYIDEWAERLDLKNLLAEAAR